MYLGSAPCQLHKIPSKYLNNWGNEFPGRPSQLFTTLMTNMISTYIIHLYQCFGCDICQLWWLWVKQLCLILICKLLDTALKFLKLVYSEFPDINIISEMLNELEVEARDFDFVFVSTTRPTSNMPPLFCYCCSWENLSRRVLGAFF